MIVAAYAAYLIADVFYMSGSIAIITCGVIQVQYAAHNISPASKTTVKNAAKMLA